MAEARYLPPRRGVKAVYMHPADVVDGVTQRQMLQQMTDKELMRIAESVNAELATRGTKDVDSPT